jgi:hypothetical protein
MSKTRIMKILEEINILNDDDIRSTVINETMLERAFAIQLSSTEFMVTFRLSKNTQVCSLCPNNRQLA